MPPIITSIRSDDPLRATARIHARAVELLGARTTGTGSASVKFAVPPALAAAAPRRLATFLAGRYCAMRAVLDATGIEDGDIGIGEDGGPLWPRGVVGSITHTDSVAIAAVAPAALVSGLGIDCETVMSSDVAHELTYVVFGDARERAVAMQGDGRRTWPEMVTIVFSAKESLYKCLRPLVGLFFDFHAARLVRLSGDTAHLVLTRDLGSGFCAGRELRARFSMTGGRIYTSVLVERSPATLPHHPWDRSASERRRSPAQSSTGSRA